MCVHLYIYFIFVSTCICTHKQPCLGPLPCHWHPVSVTDLGSPGGTVKQLWWQKLNMWSLFFSPSGSELWNLIGSDSQPRVISPPILMSSGHLATSRNILVVIAGGCYRRLLGKVRDAAKQPSKHRTVPPTQHRLIWSTMSIMLKLKNPRIRVDPEPKGRNILSKTVIVWK